MNNHREVRVWWLVCSQVASWLDCCLPHQLTIACMAKGLGHIRITDSMYTQISLDSINHIVGLRFHQQLLIAVKHTSLLLSNCTFEFVTCACTVLPAVCSAMYLH